MALDLRERPNRVPWPPLLLIAALAAAWLLERQFPAGQWFQGALWPLRAIGIVLAGVGLGFDLAAMERMRRARTNVMPHRAAQHLVTGGVFAWSRNPIYFGNTLLLVGIALAWPAPWLLVTAALATLLVDRLAIRREEQHLAARFGPEFAAYRRRVRRWIGRRAPADDARGNE